jgi:diguanylate cyclase (GGDEF)-like protein
VEPNESSDAVGKVPTPPVPQGAGGGPELELIGEAIKARVEEVCEATVARTVRFDGLLDPMTQDAFERIARTSTVAVARWICGEPLEVTVEAGRETWEIFAELAVHRAATLDQVTWRCFWWRDVMAETVRAVVAEHRLSDEALAAALNLLQISLEFSLVRMCECFETERRRTDEALAHREEELAFMATHDSLTGLPNRTLILDRAEQMLARSRRANSPVAALFIDLDNFKDINDTLGHGMGDELLKAVAARLDFVTREADALGRLGGDEFVVISDELSLDVAPELVAERMLEALAPPFELGPEGETRVNVSASIGIAIAEESSAEELLRNADIAMYRAKWDGAGRYAVFEAGMQERVQNRVELEMDLRTAVENGEFFLAYQPTIDLDSMAPTGVEALLRWRHPERGVMQPDAFIPILEESGLIVEIGRWVLGEACRQGAAWRDAGHPIGMSVNVSARQLDDEQIVTDIEDALAASGLEASQLTIEVTETTLMRDVEETVRLLAAVKDLGVQIAIDDFGTGYSSLAHLRRFPVDALKIDRSFVTGMRENREGQTLIRTLVQLGKALSIETLAEGIEEHDELSLLKDENCDSGQGFLFARPLDAEATEAFLAGHDLPMPEPASTPVPPVG